MMDINEIKKEFDNNLTEVKNLIELNNLRIKYLGRQGIITALFKKIKELKEDERKEFGKICNELKREIEEKLLKKKEELEKEEVKEEEIDITLPGRCRRIGTLHPLTQILNEIKQIFISLGFDVVEGPEIETDYYNFEGLNIPKGHPAREEWDSFYITSDILLRSHTSPVQLRVMEKSKPPLRVISPGRCYRRDKIDNTHSHTFHQVEGFMVDKQITFCDLKGILSLFAKKMFSEEVKLRLRPDYFPFTEPSADGAISCIICKSKGCKVCSYSGFLEIFGCGMIYPKVLENVNIDPEEWTGFAFGMGVERIAMIKYGIDDIRLFLENDLNFLLQF